MYTRIGRIVAHNTFHYVLKRVANAGSAIAELHVDVRLEFLRQERIERDDVTVVKQDLRPASLLDADLAVVLLVSGIDETRRNGRTSSGCGANWRPIGVVSVVRIRIVRWRIIDLSRCASCVLRVVACCKRGIAYGKNVATILQDTTVSREYGLGNRLLQRGGSPTKHHSLQSCTLYFTTES